MAHVPIAVVGPPFALEVGGAHAWRFRLLLGHTHAVPPTGRFRLALRWATAAGPYPDTPPTDLILPGPLIPGRPRDVVVPVPTPEYPGDYRLEAVLDTTQPGGPPAGQSYGVRTAVTVHGTAAQDINYHDVYRTANLAENHWWVVGAFKSKEEYDESSAARLQLLRSLGLTETGRVLDIGCGTGQMAQCLEGFLAPPGKYCGTDIAEEAMAYCRGRFRKENFAFARGGMTTVPFTAADGPFDFVIFFSVFTHVYPDETALLLGEARRLLAPGGQVIADAFFSPLVERHGGNRGEMFQNKEHFDRLVRLAGFDPPELLRSFVWNPHADRHMMRLRAAA